MQSEKGSNGAALITWTKRLRRGMGGAVRVDFPLLGGVDLPTVRV